jgi:hypothetical protein
MTTPTPAPLGLPVYDYTVTDSSLETHPGAGDVDGEPTRKDNKPMDELTEIRAALMQMEKALETQRACVIRVRKVIDRRLGIAQTEAPRASNTTIAGAVRSHTSTTAGV